MKKAIDRNIVYLIKFVVESVWEMFSDLDIQSAIWLQLASTGKKIAGKHHNKQQDKFSYINLDFS